MLGMQRALSLIYPDQCILCPELVETTGGLCASCWREMPFLRGLVCNTCGVSLPGHGDAEVAQCDECLVMAPPWVAGRAALAYRDKARRLVLLLKHGDRPDLAGPAASWMEAAGRPIMTPDMLLGPVPIHWSRLISRRYNQSVELGRKLSRQTGLPFCPDALCRTRRTPVQDGLGVDARRANVAGAVCANPRHRAQFAGRDICLIDDVMTSGATLSAAADACHDAGARRVTVLVLARVEKAP